MEDLEYGLYPTEVLTQTYTLYNPAKSKKTYQYTMRFNPLDLENGLTSECVPPLPEYWRDDTVGWKEESGYAMLIEQEYAVSQFVRYVIGVGMKAYENKKPRFLVDHSITCPNYRFLPRAEIEKFPLISQQWLRCFNIPKWETRAEKS